VGVHVQVGLGALLGLDDEPGEIAGWGSVPASVARDIVSRQQRCEWRFAVHDEDGLLLSEGITRRRPRPPDARRAATPPYSNAVVEIHVPAVLLSELTADPRGPSGVAAPSRSVSGPESVRWSEVIDDVARQHALTRRDDADPSARFPTRAQRRRIEIRYRQCLFPGCRRPARRSDIDHRRDHSRGGATADDNLGPLCRHDHQNKTEGGWRLLRAGATRFCWISPLGRRHVVDVPPVAMPLPRSAPRPAAEVDARFGADENTDWDVGVDAAAAADGRASSCWTAPLSLPPREADGRTSAVPTPGSGVATPTDDDEPPF
jgi:hypothetical protein